jgi:CRP-like cAMP-binding protein
MVQPALAPNPERELLQLLARRSTEQVTRGDLIYSPLRPSANLYLVVSGRVKVSSTPTPGETVCRLVFQGGLFGEPALIPSSNRLDTAVALDAVSIMSWTSAEIESQVAVNPRLGVILCQYLVRQCLELSERMESLIVHKTPDRVMLALAQIARRTGVEMPDGSLRFEPLTHQTLAEYVGTSREVVTCQLNRLRSLGFIRYSRQYIEVSVNKLEGSLR